MKKAAAPTTTKPPIAHASFTAGDIALQFLDTTWRIAVPVVIGALLGIFADRALATKPWLTLLGTILGFVGAALLVKRQLDAALKEEDS
jgi:F0F1-type ATP synthase assembly protein I